MKNPKVKTEGTIKYFPHNELLTCSKFLNNRLQERIKTNDKSGIFFDAMACLTMAAFAVEAYINFLGEIHCKIKWKKNDGYLDRIKKVCEHYSIDSDSHHRPLKTIIELKNFRNSLAHAKPIIKELTPFIEPLTSDLFDPNHDPMAHSPWNRKDIYDLCNIALEDIEQLWRTLLEKAGIPLHETLSKSQFTKLILDEQ